MTKKDLLILRNRTALNDSAEFFSSNNVDAFYQEISISENINNLNLDNIEADIVLITSQNALKAIEDNLNWCNFKKIYCLNSKISSKVKLHNLIKLNWKNTKELSKYIIKNEKPNQKIVHLCADNANKLFYTDLEKLGFEIEPINVYRTKFVNSISSDILEKLKSKEIKYIMLFSAESIKATQQIFKANNLNLNNYKAICFSKKMAKNISNIYSEDSTLKDMLKIYKELEQNNG